MRNAMVLGAGMVGSVMARDLAAGGEFRVTVADRSDVALERLRAVADVECVQADLSDPKTVRGVVAGEDVVLGALASTIGLAAMRAVIEAGLPYCDVSFMAEDPREMDGLARERGATVVYDCGVAPGMSNLFAGHAAAWFETCDRIDLYVGGIPADPRPPFHYKAAFAPMDVLEEYTRPARMVEDGQVVVREALSGVEVLRFQGVGDLEAFCTDGLRSLVDTLDVPHMSEKTLRYPGHADLMRTYRETGLFSKDPVEVDGGTVRPLDVTAALLIPMWTYEDGEDDLTVFRAVAEGEREGGRSRLTWELLDRRDAATGLSSMSRTTALPATIVARLIADGRFVRPGVHPPEALAGDRGVVDRMLSELAARGVHYERRVETLD